MSVLDGKLRRDLWQSKGMLLALVAIVTVGVGCMSGLFATSRNLNLARSDYYQRTHLGDFWIDLKKAPVSEAVRLASVPGVASVRERIVAPVILDMEGVDRPLSGQMISLPAEEKGVINGVLVQSGSYFTSFRPNEVLVDHAFATERGIDAGDDLHLLINGEQKDLVVVGTAISSEFVYLMPPGSIVPEPSNYGIFYVKRAFAEEAMGFEGACNNIVGFLTPQARRQPDFVLDTLSKRLASFGVFSTTPLSQQASNLSLSSELSGLATMATILPLIFLCVAALVLNVLMTRLAEQQRGIVGTLKALGYGNGAITAHYMKIGAIVGLSGGVAGCLMGYALADGLTYMYRGFFTFPVLENHFYPDLACAALGTALFFSLLGTIRGVRHVTSLTPAEAMRQAAPPEGGSVPLEKWPWLWKRLGFRWQLSLRNIFRNRVRSLVTVFAAAMGTALLVSTFGMVDSLKFMLSFQFDKLLLSDFSLSFSDELDTGAVNELSILPGVLHVEPVLEVACDFENGFRRKKGMVTGLMQNAQLTLPRDGEGNTVAVPSTGLLMTRRLAELMDLRPGDAVTVIPTKGLQEPFTTYVANVVDSLFGLPVYADFHYLNRMINEADAVSKLQLRARMTPLERRLFLRQCKRYPKLTNIGDRQLQQGLMQVSFVDKLGSMAYPMIFFAAIIFFGSILNAGLIGIIERKREIATYRVLGYTALEVGNLLLRESMVVNLLGILAGLPLGKWMLDGMALQYKNDMYVMPSVIAPSSWLLSIGMAILFVLLCQAIIQRNISRLEWNEALSMKE